MATPATSQDAAQDLVRHPLHVVGAGVIDGRGIGHAGATQGDLRGMKGFVRQER